MKIGDFLSRQLSSWHNCRSLYSFLWSSSSTCLPFCFRPGWWGAANKMKGKLNVLLCFVAPPRAVGHRGQRVVFVGGPLLETNMPLGIGNCCFVFFPHLSRSPSPIWPSLLPCGSRGGVIDLSIRTVVYVAKFMSGTLIHGRLGASFTPFVAPIRFVILLCVLLYMRHKCLSFDGFFVLLTFHLPFI